jgi:hypothetical protein
MFILVADVLQRLIHQAWGRGSLSHPLASDIPCPILQYADDTLILCKASTSAAGCLREVLEDFAVATGLAINFHKSCFVPMNVPPPEAVAMAVVLGCPISSFPQPYLGLPLSPTKLPSSAFAPLLLSVDRRLLGWRAHLLSSGGRLVLCNAVLNNLATYFMCSYLLPRGVIDSIDKRCRAFFWTGKDSCSGARCLTAWDKVVSSKQERGVGIKDLHRQNRCLLLNFVHQLHQPILLPWKSWFFAHTCRDLGELSTAPSFLEKIVLECLSTVAEAELSMVCQIIDDTRLGTVPDNRFIDSTSAPRFSSREAYRMLSPPRPRDVSACIAWSLRLPSKLRIFAYLLDIDRLSTRANLFYKHYAPSGICASCPATETGRHLLFDFRLAAAVWTHLDVPIPDGQFSIWYLRSPLLTSDATWRMGVATTLWAIWKSRNDLVFNGRPSTPSSTLLRACDDLVLWRWRLSIADRDGLARLRSYVLAKA